MKKILLLFSLSFVLHASFAQVGVYAGIQQIKAPRWESIFQEEYNSPNVNPFSYASVLGIDFQFPSKTKGYRLAPSIHFSDLRTILEYTLAYENPTAPTELLTLDYEELHQVTFAALAIQFDWYFLDTNQPANTSIYDKEGHWLSKGLFLQIAPSAQIISTTKDRLNTNLLESTTGVLATGTEVKYPLRIGLGLDLGIASAFTLSPIINYTFFGKTNFRGFGITPAQGIDYDSLPDTFFESNIHQFQAGLRLGTWFRKK